MTDSSCLVKILSKTKPDEVYNLGAQSHVGVSFDVAEYTAEVDGIGTLRLLDAIRTCGLEQKVKFYQASTSEMFGKGTLGFMPPNVDFSGRNSAIRDNAVLPPITIRLRKVVRSLDNCKLQRVVRNVHLFRHFI